MNRDVRAWIQDGGRPVFPLHKIGREAVFALDLENLAVTLGLALMMARNDRPIT
jgi:hypothetical protein